MHTLANKIKSEALRIGFSFCGIARAESLEDQKSFNIHYIRQKRHRNLHYLETHLEKRLDPRLLMKDAKSVIALLMNYYPLEIIPEEDNFIISKYAYGKDHHDVMKVKTEALIRFMKDRSADVKARAFVDSGTVMEKTWAQRCGVGWQGKNTIIINKAGGSFFFIGIILTNLELEYDQPEPDHCGDCDKCLWVCPTGALDHPYELNLARCLAYLTIEKNDGIPDELKNKFSDRIFGCDICQDICPYNRFARPHSEPAFLPGTRLKKLRKADWMALEEEDFNRIFDNSAVKRTGYEQLMRTIRSVSGK